MQAGVEEALCFNAALEPQFGTTHTHTLAPQRTRQRLCNGTLEAHVVAQLKSIRPVPRQGIGEALLLLSAFLPPALELAPQAVQLLRAGNEASLHSLDESRVLVIHRRIGMCYHGWHMDVLREWTESDLDVIMVGTWMLCGNGWSLIWT